jgi:hypothetical protein
MSNSVFVLDTLERPLMPCRPSRARCLLRDGKAAVYRLQPFTIILKYPVEPTPPPVELKADPGSQTTGLARVLEGKRGRQVAWVANLHHRGMPSASAWPTAGPCAVAAATAKPATAHRASTIAPGLWDGCRPRSRARWITGAPGWAS